MAFSIFDASIPVFVSTLRNLEALMAKAEAHAANGGGQLPAYLEARLAADMHPLTRQIQMASDAAKSGAARLAGLAPPSFPDVETTWPELKTRLAKTIEFVESIPRGQVEGAEDRTIKLPLPGRTMTFTGSDFLLRFALPNFFFHVVTAYGLLRQQGVPLGKMDYLAGGTPIPA